MKIVKSETSLDLKCYSNMLTDDGPLSQVKAVEKKLQIDSSEQIKDTLTREELQIAGEMFLYLTMCPDAIKPWIVFYKVLFKTQSPHRIILTLNRVMKGPRTKTNKCFKNMAEILLKRILNFLPGRKAVNTAINAEGEAIEARPPPKLEGNYFTLASLSSLVCLCVRIRNFF